jgi:DNA-binding transcriptional ArsR family regulator
VAPARLSLVLDVEEPTADRPPARAVRRSGPGPRAVDRESPLGRASDPWRASEAGDLGESVDRSEVHAAVSTSTIPDVADLPKKPLPVTRPAVSQHLRVLKDAGLVFDRAEGTRRVYTVNAGGLERLRADLDRFWTQALTAFKSEAERSPKSERDKRKERKEP